MGKCKWERVEVYNLGVPEIEYQTSCGSSISDSETKLSWIYCFNCGKEFEIVKTPEST